MVQQDTAWVAGDRVLHPTKPEWGEGVVLKAHKTTHEGKPCQRLEIRFARAGSKTISTAFVAFNRAAERPAIEDAIAEDQPTEQEAEAQKAENAQAARKEPPAKRRSAKREQEETADRLSKLDPVRAGEIMARLPETTRDPFLGVDARMKNTLELFRFEPRGRSLLDWASIQSGLSDPLSAFSRHDLEQHFARFKIALENHLSTLIAEAKRGGYNTASITEGAPAAAQQAVRRLNAMR